MTFSYFQTVSCAALTFALLASGSSAMAQDAGETPSESGAVMVVMDASGSMWGQIDGKTKIEIARDTLRTSLGVLAPDSEIGLIAYGHRRKGDCGDIEVLAKPATGNASRIAKAVDALNPKGKTPLSAAVRMAAEELQSTEQKATVILLTDGLETCSADPCALGRELEASGVDFTTHVIGFGLSRDEGRKIACLADETGGRYISAENAEELGTAIDETIVRTGEEEPATPPQAIPAATISGPPQVAIGETFTVTWEGPGDEYDYIDIMDASTDRTSQEAAYTWAREGSPLSITAPGTPGAYNLRYVWQSLNDRHVIAQIPLTIVKGDFAVTAPDQSSVGATIPVEWEASAALPRSYIDLVPAGYSETSGEISYSYIEDGSPTSLLAPVDPGEYEIRFILEAPDGRSVKFSRPILITDAEAAIDFPARVKAGESFSLTWSGPAAGSDYVDLVPAGYTETSGELDYAYVADGDVLEMTAPDVRGSYQVRYILEAGMGLRRVMVSAPLTVE